MANTTSLSVAIDDMIHRASNVYVHKEHWKLIATTLSHLRQRLDERVSQTNKNCLHDDLDQTFKIIDKMLIICSNDTNSFNPITYKDLEHVLLAFQCRLAQYDADMTDEYEIKTQILRETLLEQQNLMQKSLDAMMKQKIEEIEQKTKQDNIEQLHLLRQKYKTTMECYLRSCIESHQNYSFTSLTSKLTVKVAHDFYKITPEDQTRLEKKLKPCYFPLAHTFIRLKSDRFASLRRYQADQSRTSEENNALLIGTGREKTINKVKEIWERLILTPHLTSRIERNGCTTQEDDANEDNIIRTKRWITLFGDPGSGKTCYTRRLTHDFAQKLILYEKNLNDYGVMRIPILIHIGEFSETLKQKSSLTLFDYIGKHQWNRKPMIDDSSISTEDLSCFLQECVKQGQALIILDGLDEFSQLDQRSNVISIIKTFIDTYIPASTDIFVSKNDYLSTLSGDPSRSRGNQIIVTSRLINYDGVPLAEQFVHYRIQPMDTKHIHDFIDYWFFHLHQHIINTLGFPLVNQAESHSQILKIELEKADDLRDMASNISLISLICTIYCSQLDHGHVSDQFTFIHDRIINSVLSCWIRKRTVIDMPKLIQILNNIAVYIYDHSLANVIHEQQIKEMCAQLIRISFNKTIVTEEDSLAVESQACEWVRVICEDVGILAVLGESLFGFRHFVFQEYFACLKLIDVCSFKKKSIVDRLDRELEIQSIVQSFRDYINDPRFHIPIMLALKKLNSFWSQNDFDDLCYEFIQIEDETNSILPLGAFILIMCASDFVSSPSEEILFNALDRLIIAAGQHQWSIVCPFLLDEIMVSLKNFRNNVVTLWINKFLSESSQHNIQSVIALCCIIEGKPHEFDNIQWLNQSSCALLQSLSIVDNENDRFYVDRLLIQVAFSNPQLLPCNAASFKNFLLDTGIETKLIPVVLFPLIITLYGGLKRDGPIVAFDPSCMYRESNAMTPILIRFFAITDHEKEEQYLKKLEQEIIEAFLVRIKKHDESIETIDLCIAIICLLNIEYIQDNMKLISSTILRMSLNRLKYISMILRQFYFTADEHDRCFENETTQFISVVIKGFQYVDSARIHFLHLLDSLRSSLARARSSPKSLILDGDGASSVDKRVTLYLPNTLRQEDRFLNGLLSTYTQFHFDQKSCSLIHHFTKLFWIFEHDDEFNTQYRMATALDTCAEYLSFHNNEDILFPITFIPLHLQNLYVRLLKQNHVMINSKNSIITNRQHLYFGHILMECLMQLSNPSYTRLSIFGALITLLPWLRMQNLENFGSSLLWTLAIKDPQLLGSFELKKQRHMNNETGQYMDIDNNFFSNDDLSDEERKTIIQHSIDQEYERLRNSSIENDERNIKIYSASISLAFICRWAEDERKQSLLQQSIDSAMSIENKLTRLDALCGITFYCHVDWDKIEVDGNRSLKNEIEYQFNQVYADLPLLVHAAIFIRCLPLLQHSQSIDNSFRNLFSKFDSTDQRDQQAVYEALLPHFQTYNVFLPINLMCSLTLQDKNRVLENKSSILKRNFSISRTCENSSFSLFISNLYLLELTNDLHDFLKIDTHHHQYIDDESIIKGLSLSEQSILTEAQAITITSLFSCTLDTNQCKVSSKFWHMLSDALHNIRGVELKSFRQVESWLKLRDSNEFSSFAYHAALLLINSNIWSIEAVTIVCDLLCSDNDRFCQRAEILSRSSSDVNVRTSSKLGIDVLLTLIKKKAYFQSTSASAKLSLNRLLGNITIDNLSHLETLLWLERYRIHALNNAEYTLNKPRLREVPYLNSFLTTDTPIDICCCINWCPLSGDLVIYMCDMIASNLFAYLEIDGDTTSTEVLESHHQFVVSVLMSVHNLLNHDYDTRQMVVNALISLFEVSEKYEIQEAIAYALGYICNGQTYKTLLEKIQLAMTNECDDNSTASNSLLSTLISSYAYCIYVNQIAFDQDDMDIFCTLLKHSAQNVSKAARTGLGRALRDRSFLFEMLDFDHIQCYDALVGSTACLFLYDIQEKSVNNVVDFIQENPTLLPIFMVDLYNRIRHFTSTVSPNGGNDFYLAYGYPRYVEIASLIIARMPEVSCNFIKDWSNGDNLRRALFYTSKQHDFPQRAGCLTILSLLGELTTDLCEMIIERINDDPYVQNICYKSIAHIRTIKDKEAVFHLLSSHLKSNSMNVRYISAKILLRLSQLSLIPFEEVRKILTELILDSSSNEGLWLIQGQAGIFMSSLYNYIGPLKDVIYSLLVQHITRNTSDTAPSRDFNEIDLDFFKSGKSSRLASCLYENKAEENNE